MELLGDRNWWQPSWMHRLLPDRAGAGPAAASRPPSTASPSR
jgi:hypothetical protein